MRSVLVALLFVQLAFAINRQIVANTQTDVSSTVLKPAATQTQQGQGSTVLTATPPAQQQQPAQQGKPMTPAKIDTGAPCGCAAQVNCDCLPQFVAPEVKIDCACLNQPGCACAEAFKAQATGQKVYATDSCGCLHEVSCACRPQYVQPETKETHTAPELRDAQPACGCANQPGCACQKDLYREPEIKKTCDCEELLNVPCACRAGLSPTAVVTVVKTA